MDEFALCGKTNLRKSFVSCPMRWHRELIFGKHACLRKKKFFLRNSDFLNDY